MQEQNNPMNSLAHTKWNCKYHIVFGDCQKGCGMGTKSTGGESSRTVRYVAAYRRRRKPGGFLPEGDIAWKSVFTWALGYCLSFCCWD